MAQGGAIVSETRTDITQKPELEVLRETLRLFLSSDAVHYDWRKHEDTSPQLNIVELWIDGDIYDRAQRLLNPE